jgi:tetratricopeptide (TPR) repeat protein
VRFLDDPPESFSLHRLVQEVVRLRLGSKRRSFFQWILRKPKPFRRARETALRLVEDWAPSGGQDISTWPKWEVLGPHCEALFARSEAEAWGDPEPVPYLLNGFGQFQEYRNGAYAAAEPLYRRALEARERVLGTEHPNTLTSLNNLAALLDSTGDYAAAEPLCRRALEARERVLGAEHPDTLNCLNNLAALLDSKGDYAAAEPLYRRALEARERVLGAEHPDTLTSLNNLALLLRAKGDYAAAEPLYRRALEAKERVLGAEHPSTLFSLNNLGMFHFGKGEYAEAEPLVQRAAETLEQLLGPEHPNVVGMQKNLEICRAEMGGGSQA